MACCRAERDFESFFHRVAEVEERCWLCVGVWAQGSEHPLMGLAVWERPFTLEVRLPEGWLVGHRQKNSQYERLFIHRQRMHDDDDDDGGGDENTHGLL